MNLGGHSWLGICAAEMGGIAVVSSQEVMDSLNLDPQRLEHRASISQVLEREETVRRDCVVLRRVGWQSAYHGCTQFDSILLHSAASNWGDRDNALQSMYTSIFFWPAILSSRLVSLEDELLQP